MRPKNTSKERNSIYSTITNLDQLHAEQDALSWHIKTMEGIYAKKYNYLLQPFSKKSTSKSLLGTFALPTIVKTIPKFWTAVKFTSSVIKFFGRRRK